MDSASATAPLVVLGVAGLGLLVVAVAAVLLLRPGRRSAPEPAGGALVEDDLPGFHAHPPGSPGAAVRPVDAGGPVPLARAGGLAAPPAPGPSTVPSDEGVRVIRFLLAFVALALALIAAAAAVALPSAWADHAGSAAPHSRAPAGSAVVVPDLPAVPDSPAPGRPGAGRLAYVSLPVGSGDTRARLSFGEVVLEQQAVGATVTSPAASLTMRGDEALLHLRLPTWNCLAPEEPADPVATGCVPSVTEFGDLPSPALSMFSDGKSLLLQGRVPTYTRPNGGDPEYTGRVYQVTLTVRPGRRLGPSRYVADGVLTLGSGTAHSDGNPLLNVLTRGH